MTDYYRILAAAMFAACAACTPSPESGTETTPGAAESSDSDEPRGLRLNEAGATPGYVLYSPLLSDKTYSIDSDGMVVHMWESERAPGAAVYLLDNGHLLRTEREPDVPVFTGGGQGGRIREFTWDGEVVWDYLFTSEEHLLHHDIEPMPNGNILAISWESKTLEETRQAGRRPERIPEAGIWPDMVIEFEPQPPDGARIVWEWRSWDHLVQDTDATLANYGEPSAHPHRIDINGDGEPEEIDPEELEQLKALGYVSDDTDEEDLQSDFFHTNAIDYNAELDQIVLSAPRFNEIWIIDHSTTTEEAAGGSGGTVGERW